MPRSRRALEDPLELAAGAAIACVLLVSLTACGGAEGGGEAVRTGDQTSASSAGDDALACAQAKDYEDEARRVDTSVRNPLSDDFEVQKEYERQRSAANREVQRLRRLAATARQVCGGSSDPATAQAAPPVAANPTYSYFSPYGDQAQAPPPSPPVQAAERAVPGTFPIKVEQNDFNIPEDYTVKELRLYGSETLTLRGLVQAGGRCASGLEVRVDMSNSGAPFTTASATVDVASGATAEAIWDLQVSPDSYDAKTMAFSFEAVWLHGTC